MKKTYTQFRCFMNSSIVKHIYFSYANYMYKYTVQVWSEKD